MSETRDFDVLVIGGGSGLTAAYHAGKDGKSVAVVERREHAFGGTCVNFGCIPTKGLIQAAEILQAVRSAPDFGVHLDQESVRVDFPRVMEIVRQRRASSAASVRSWVESDFEAFIGHGRFVDDRTVEMEDGTRVRGETVFIAAGARPQVPELPGLAEAGFWTNEDVLEATEQPDSLIIVGGGYIGVELGHFFSTIGTDVTLIGRDQCLLDEDDEVRALFTRLFSRKVDFLAGHDAVRAFDDDGRPGVVARDRDGGDEKKVTAERLLMATGRRPNTDGLDVERSGVELDEHGWIRVNDRLQTANPKVYAYGDVIGQGMFKHTSSYEGELAYRNAQGADRAVSYRTNPHAVFSDPQIGSVGLTEEACQEQGLDFNAVRKDHDSIARGRIIGSPEGFAKLLVEKSSDRILGFHMVGPHAADLIHEVVVAMNAGDGRAGLIRDTIHVHPTLPELVRSVFDAAAD